MTDKFSDWENSPPRDIKVRTAKEKEQKKLLKKYFRTGKQEDLNAYLASFDTVNT